MMAFPFLALALAGAGLAGSTFFNQRAQAAVERARKQAIRDEDERQRQLIAEANAAQLEAEQPFEEADVRQQREESSLLRDLQPTRLSVAVPAPGVAPAAPGIVAGSAAAEAGRSGAFTGQQARALANLRGLGNFLFEAQREGLRPGELIAERSRAMQRSAGILPLELEEANQKGQTDRMIADLFGLARDIGVGAAAPGVASLFGGGSTPAIVGGGSSLGGQGAFNIATQRSLPLRVFGGSGGSSFLPFPRSRTPFPAPTIPVPTF